MDLSIPILICEEREEIRTLIRTMLTKHGFFHLIEAMTPEEVVQLASREKKHFMLIHKDLLNDRVKSLLNGRKHFLVISPTEDNATLELASRYGVNHLISFPYSSKKLAEKITEMSSQN